MLETRGWASCCSGQVPWKLKGVKHLPPPTPSAEDAELTLILHLADQTIRPPRNIDEQYFLALWTAVGEVEAQGT